MGIFDTFVSPVALYASEILTPVNLPQKNFKNQESMLAAWENYQPELINQKMGRLLLSVHRKASRLAVLGELGRMPLIIRALGNALKYEWHLSNVVSPNSLVSLALREMKEGGDLDSGWFNRVDKLKKTF